MYPAPSSPTHRAEYSRVFEQLESFEQPFTGIAFDRALLDRPAPHKDDDMHDALRAVAERRLVRLARRAPYSLRVREALVRQGSPMRSDMASIARALGLSVRSLRRRLVAEGKSYNEVVNEAQAIFACKLLREEQRTIQETAFEMGFSDPRAFHRAFKRWTGTTPSAYLDELRDKV
jgi:AraC-like DNA-binding protein